MRLLGLAFLVSVMNFQGAFANNFYDPQFQTIKSFKVVEVVEDDHGVEDEKLILKKNFDDFFDASKDGELGNVSKEQLQRLLEASRKVPTKVPAKEEKPVKETTTTTQQSKTDGVIKILDKIVAVGQKLYKIVASGKPELTMSSNPVSVVPMDEKGKVVEPFLLENWEVPKSKKFKVTIENYMGIDVVDFEFMVIFSYGGSFAGSGKYITSAQIKPTYVDVMWGFTFDVNCNLQSIMNRGSKEDPVAGALLMVDYRIVTVIQERVVNKTFYIDGLGNLQVH